MTWKAAAQVEPLNMPTTLKFVLVKYANHADNDGYDTWPSYERVAHFTGHSVKTVQRAVERLRAEGVLVAQGDPYGGRGRRGRGVAYRLDFERAQELYGYWIEKRTNKGFAFELVKRKKDPKVVAAAWREAQKAAQKAALETPDRESSVSGTETQDSEAQTPDSHDLNPGHGPGATRQKSAIPSDEPSRNPPKCARAPKAGGGRPDGPPPACAVWRDNRAALEALSVWPLLERAIPDADDGEVLTLAVETPLVGFGILTWAAPAAEAVLGRRVACRVRHWVQAALVERGIMRVGTANSHRHRRDGQAVGLNDPAWRLWCAHAGEIEALPAAHLLVNCLPDDLDQNGLHLCTDTMATRCALIEEAGAQAAEVLGVAIVPTTMWCLDLILAARVATDRAERDVQAKEAGGHG